MGLRWSGGELVQLVEAAGQRQAYNNFRKVRVLYRKIVERTPVLSGALRVNWNATYGTPDYSYTDVSGNKNRTSVRIPAPVFPLEYDPKKAWHIYIANGTPYAQRIENGWSDQAPVGMVKISIMEVFGSGLR
jgi:hypothetical protein